MKEAVVFSANFEYPEKFEKFLEEKQMIFEKGTGIFMTYDENIVNFVKENYNFTYHGTEVQAMKGKDSLEYKAGFAGTATIVEFDETRKWGITFNKVDCPIVQYLEIKSDDNNFTIFRIID